MTGTRIGWTGAASLALALVLSPGAPTAQASTAVEDRAAFDQALAHHRHEEAARHAERLLSRPAADAALLDELTYRLSEAGAGAQALALLMKAYPFPDAPADLRATLVGRVALAASRHPDAVGGDDLARLRVPLDAPVLRRHQAAIFGAREQCETVRLLLGDIHPDYEYDDLMRLGACSERLDPAGAARAFAAADARRPHGPAARALAYQAHAMGDYATALRAWRSLDAGLQGDHLLAASRSALVADAPGDALTWMARYAHAGGARDYEYWALLASAHRAADDPAAEAVALERAIGIQPAVHDLRRRAALEMQPERRVSWLAQALELEDARSATLAELGYAYQASGRLDDALAAWADSLALDPDDGRTQLARGYAAWELNRTREARVAFEQALRLDPGNVAIVEQLVYVYQRLAENDRARALAARVIDAGGSGDAAVDARRYGLQRLHEDLGRRLTVSLDGFSGTSVGAGASQAEGRYSSYGQVELDVRLGRPAIRHGRTVSAFVRLTGDGGPERHAAPVHNPVLGAGLRWKPLSRYVLYLSGEGRTALDDSSRRDVLLRASASLFNADRFSDDWRPDGRGWLARNLYLDAAHFVDARYTALTADLRTSYHVKAGAGRTVEPYARLQGALHRSDAVTREVRAGAGARWNVWYGGSRYDAPPHRLSIGIELQQAIETTLPERRGVFLSLGSRW